MKQEDGETIKVDPENEAAAESIRSAESSQRGEGGMLAERRKRVGSSRKRRC